MDAVIDLRSQSSPMSRLLYKMFDNENNRQGIGRVYHIRCTLKVHCLEPLLATGLGSLICSVVHCTSTVCVYVIPCAANKDSSLSLLLLPVTVTCGCGIEAVGVEGSWPYSGAPCFVTAMLVIFPLGCISISSSTSSPDLSSVVRLAEPSSLLQCPLLLRAPPPPIVTNPERLPALFFRS